MRKPLYGNFDGQASRYDGWIEAWVLSEDRTEWYEINSASHDNAVREITKAEFEAKFPNIPPLPPQAFKRLARLFAGLTPDQQETVRLAMSNHPGASLAKAIAILDAFGL